MPCFFFIVESDFAIVLNSIWDLHLILHRVYCSWTWFFLICREKMASNGVGNGEFSFDNKRRTGLPKIQTQKTEDENVVCHDDSATPVKAQTLEELHSLQKKKSAPTTPIKSPHVFGVAVSEEERQKQQLQSIR